MMDRESIEMLSVRIAGSNMLVFFQGFRLNSDPTLVALPKYEQQAEFQSDPE